MNEGEPPPAGCTIDRGFVRLRSGLVHYRQAGHDRAGGGRLPLLMAHSGPGSSAGLVPLINELGVSRRVVAPDMPGNGDSDAPAQARTDLAYYVDAAVQTLDRLGLDRVDFYGQHTGAHIGCELALAHPQRVRRLVLDGIALFPDDLKPQLVAHYAPRVAPDEHGGHLAWAWHFVSELGLHFPYFLRDPAHRLNLAAVPPTEVRQRLVVDLLKALPSYHLAYHAVFEHATAERLELLQLPTLVMAVEDDPLARYLDGAAALVRGAARACVPRVGRGASIREFLDR